MGLETATYVQDLTEANPLSNDKRHQGDDHIRLIKDVLKATFPSASKPLYPDAAKVTVASAATADVLGAASDYVEVSGSTTISSFGTGTHRRKLVRFTGAPLIEHDATTLILPEAADFQARAGDVMYIESDGSSNVRVLWHWRAAQMSEVSQGRLALSGTDLVFSRYNGRSVLISGRPQEIPAAGVTLTDGGVANTLYYIYAHMNNGVMELGASTTGYARDSTYGYMVKSGDPTRTYLGLAKTGAAVTTWLDDAQHRYVCNYYNRRWSFAQSNYAADRSTVAAFFTELNSADRFFFVAHDDEDILVSYTGSHYNTSASQTSQFALRIDGDANLQVCHAVYANVNASFAVPFSSTEPLRVSDGEHHVRRGGGVGGGTLYLAAANGRSRVWIHN